jgi:hypothetical protein
VEGPLTQAIRGVPQKKGYLCKFIVAMIRIQLLTSCHVVSVPAGVQGGGVRVGKGREAMPTVLGLSPGEDAMNFFMEKELQREVHARLRIQQQVRCDGWLHLRPF